MDSGYAKGILAYDAWQEMLLDDRNFPVDGVYDDLFLKMLVQDDAVKHLHDGRSHGAMYMRELANNCDGGRRDLLLDIADHFDCVSGYASNMMKIVGDWQAREETLKKLEDREVRNRIGQLIISVKAEDEKALQGIRQLV